MTIDRLGARATRGLTALASFSLVAALACGGVAGCGSSNASHPPASEDGGDAAGGGEDAQGTDAPAEGASDAPGTMDAPGDAGMEASAEDAPAEASAEDAPAEAAADAPGDAPGDAAADAPGEASDGAAGPVAVFSTALIDEGAGSCGAAAGVSTSFSIQNTGSATLTVTATIGGTVFSVSPTSLTVAAGATGTLAISAVVPASSTAGSAISGSMALTTNDPANATATIPLSVTPTGATLAWAASSPSAANFGVQPENQAATPMGLTLANTGNAAASVTLGTPTNAQFSLSPASGSVAAGGTLALTAGFTPSTTTASSATSAFTVTGAVCGSSLTSLSFSGQGGVGVVNGWPTGTIDFLGNPCGGSAPAGQTFTLSNSGGVDAHVTGVTFTGYAGYQSSAGVGATIPAGGSLVATLTAPAIPFPSAVPGSYGGQVTYTTDVLGDTPHQVSLTEHAVGAILAYDTSATPSFGNFGTVPAGTTANQGFAIVNNGNAVSSVTLSSVTSGAPFSLAPAGPFNLSGGSSQSDTASFAPLTYGPFTSAVHLTGTNLCQPAPADLPLTGTGQAGGIALSTQSLAFAVNCGATAATQQITVTNTGNTSMTWTAQLPNGTASDSLYSFSPSTATLAAGASSVITVTPAAMPQYPANPSPSAFADTITITTDITNDTAHTVSLSETPLGDILSVQPTSLNFGANPINTSSAPQTFVVVNDANTGTPTANVGITSSDATDFPLSAATTTAPPGGQSAPISVQFNAPGTPGSYSSNIDISTSDVLCAPLPTSPALAAGGTATQAGPVISPPALDFQLVNCGATASPLQITAGNTGTQSYTITGLTLGDGASSYFSVSMVPASGVVAPGGSATITVTPHAIPATHSPVPDSGTFSDILTIATNANVTNPNTAVPLQMGAQGVIITNNLASTSWAFGTVNFGSTGFYNNLIKNTGNQTAQVTLTNLNYPAIFGLQGQPVSVPNGSTTLSGTFTPPSGSGTWADQGMLTVTPEPGAVFCQPLPSSWQTPTINLTGTASNNPAVSIGPSSLAFPAATCGGSLPSAQSVTLTNNGSNPQSFTAVLGSTGTATGTYYTITAATPNPVPGGGSSTITVTPTVNLTTGAGTAVGSSPYNDNVIVTLGATQYYVPITMTVNGVVLALNNRLSNSVTGYNGTSCTTISFDYYSENIGGTQVAAYSPVVTNSGNINATVSASFTGWSAADFGSTPTSAGINPGSSQSFVLENVNAGAGTHCNGGTSGWYSGQMTFSAPSMCNAPVTVNIGGYYGP